MPVVEEGIQGTAPKYFTTSYFYCTKYVSEMNKLHLEKKF